MNCKINCNNIFYKKYPIQILHSQLSNFRFQTLNFFPKHCAARVKKNYKRISRSAEWFRELLYRRRR